MRSMTFFALAFLATTQAAFTCGPALPPPPGLECPGGAATDTRSVEAGRLTEDGDFTPLVEAEREYGAQGGQHVTVALRFYAEEGETLWRHSLRLVDEDGVVRGDAAITETTCAPGWSIFTNVLLFLVEDTPVTGELQLESGPSDDQGILLERIEARQSLVVR